MTYQLITSKDAKMIIENFDSLSIEYEKKYICFDEDSKKWIGIDNSTMECWVEEFEDKETCIQWLNGEFEVK